MRVMRISVTVSTVYGSTRPIVKVLIFTPSGNFHLFNSSTFSRTRSSTTRLYNNAATKLPFDHIVVVVDPHLPQAHSMATDTVPNVLTKYGSFFSATSHSDILQAIDEPEPANVIVLRPDGQIVCRRHWHCCS